MNDVSEQYMLFELLQKGGWVSIPLLLCSLVALAIIVERLLWGPNLGRTLPREFCREVERLLAARRFEELLGLSRASSSPLAKVIIAAVRNPGRPRHELVEAVEAAGRKEALAMQRYLGILGTIAAIAPLLGLLGTVFGMIETFSVISVHGVGNAPALAGGISEALITTAMGLTIAIPALVFYRYFLQLTKRLVIEMESLALQVVEQLTVESSGQLSSSGHGRQNVDENSASVSAVAKRGEILAR